MPGSLDNHRRRLDEIDRRILELLRERNDLAAEVLQAKLDGGLPIFVPEREEQKVAAFRAAAEDLGLDPDWAEDFLRMIMSASRARQSQATFPQAPGGPRRVLLVGGGGRLGSLYGRMFASSGHEVAVLEKGDWDRAADLAAGCGLAVVTVPIADTPAVIARLSPHLGPQTLLADFTSVKQGPLQAMLAAHPGPVIGLHPMHAPDVGNLSKQLVIACPGRDPEAAAWLLDQFRLWGMRVQQRDPASHDRMMHQVQGLRHFVALLHGSFMRTMGIEPREILELSSPIYRAELMMTGRIFAQSAGLYADIVLADAERRDLLLRFAEHHGRLAELARADDKQGFVREFEAVGEFFGDFARQAMVESGYLIHRLADRFS